MNILFMVLWGMLLVIPQTKIHYHFYDLSIGFGFLTLLTIYAGFSYTFWRGIIAVTILAFVYEVFSPVLHGTLILAHLILFMVIQQIVSRIFTEAYITKSFWVFPFSFINQWLLGFVINRPDFFTTKVLWLHSLVQALCDVFLSLPLFIILDHTLERWQLATGVRKAHLKGSHFFQVKSKQRRFF